MRSLGSLLDANKGVGLGFDFLRVFLAFSICAFHSLDVSGAYCAYITADQACGSPSLDDTPFWIVKDLLVPMFFALSGFLVTASASRLSLKNFLINRVLRIVPALAVDTLVCALVIGPIFTSVSEQDYFFSRELLSYFLNIFGWVHYKLPGVFENLSSSNVNGSLWTVPLELACYVFMSLMIVTRVVRSQFIIPLIVIIFMVCCVGVQSFGVLDIVHEPFLHRIINVVFLRPASQEVTAFIFGIVAYQHRYRIPYSPLLFAFAVMLLLLIAFVLPDQTENTVFRFVLLPIVAYLTVFVGLTPMPLPKFFKTGDYSYGIYLYHGPFLQIVVSLFPVLALMKYTGAPFVFLVSLPFVVGVAWLSWHCVEKPTLALRRRVSKMAATRGLSEGTARPAEQQGAARAAGGPMMTGDMRSV